MPAFACGGFDGRAEAYESLVEVARRCRLCSRMEGRRRVLGGENGSLWAPVVFVGEAPGRLGADRSGVPFGGDRSGRDFEDLLAVAGLRRDDVFVTNAVLCNPRDERGLNARPLRSEMDHCRDFLRQTIELVDPGFVVSLGGVALAALGAIAPHRAVLAADVGRSIPWFGRVLVPLYHPGARAQIRRPLAVQREDYARLGELLRSGVAPHDGANGGRLRW
jgi:uracil-DNA glycosylase family 4